MKNFDFFPEQAPCTIRSTCISFIYKKAAGGENLSQSKNMMTLNELRKPAPTPHSPTHKQNQAGPLIRWAAHLQRIKTAKAPFSSLFIIIHYSIYPTRENYLVITQRQSKTSHQSVYVEASNAWTVEEVNCCLSIFMCTRAYINSQKSEKN